MIDEVDDRDPLGELRCAAEMVGVEMGVDQVVELLDTGLLEDREHVRGLVRQAGVEHRRLARRRHQDRGIGTKGLAGADEVNVEGVGGVHTPDTDSDSEPHPRREGDLSNPLARTRRPDSCPLPPAVTPET